MRPELEVRFQQLCEQASHETNSARLLRLVTEINKLIDDNLQRDQEQRLKSSSPRRKAHGLDN